LLGFVVFLGSVSAHFFNVNSLLAKLGNNLFVFTEYYYFQCRNAKNDFGYSLKFDDIGIFRVMIIDKKKFLKKFNRNKCKKSLNLLNSNLIVKK
jgi:hypothetical protein